MAAAPAVRATQPRILNIVAHHDDDLLFLSPGLIDSIRSGAHVRTLFFVASDYVGYPVYMKDRELGVREAYAAAAGLPVEAWVSRPYSVAGVQATLWTLGDRLSLLETRIPDGYRHTPRGAKRLWTLYADGGQVTTRPGDTFTPQTLRRDQIVGFLWGITAEYAPTAVNTLDPYADLHGKSRDTAFHQDHIAVARLVMHALGQRPDPGYTVAYHRDYSIGREAVNLTPDQVRTKQTYFGIYTHRDADAQTNKEYPHWLQRSYPVDARWRGDLVVPLPRPRTGDQGGAGPYIGERYRIVHRQTGADLGVLLAGGAPPSRGSGTTVQVANGRSALRLGAVRHGWSVLITPADGTAERCLVAAATPVTQPCADNPAQALRIEGNPLLGYRLVGTEGAALTVLPGGVLGMRASASGGSTQLWDFVPVR